MMGGESRLSAEMSQKLALFDFDGTICRGNSFHLLVAERIRSWHGLFQVLPALILRRMRVVRGNVLKNTLLSQFRGWPRTQVRDFGAVFYARKIRPILMRSALAEMALRREQGFQIVVVSGAFDFVLEPYCEEHMVEHRQGTELAYSGEICMGRLRGEEMRGEQKRLWLTNRFAGVSVDWDASFAYSDEWSDVPMLAMVGNPRMINIAGKPPLHMTLPGMEYLDWRD